MSADDDSTTNSTPSEPLPGTEPAPASLPDPAEHTALVSPQAVYPPPADTLTRAVGPVGLTRSPVAVWLLLPLVTLGIYSLVWYYKINRELRDFHPSIQVEPGLALLAMFFPIANWVTLYNTGKRIAQAQQLAGLGSPCSAGLGLVASFFFRLDALYYQSQLNRLWAQR
jgi:hypothetical protein